MNKKLQEFKEQVLATEREERRKKQANFINQLMNAIMIFIMGFGVLFIFPILIGVFSFLGVIFLWQQGSHNFGLIALPFLLVIIYMLISIDFIIGFIKSLDKKIK